MTSHLDGTAAVNMDSGTTDVSPSAKPIRDRVQACTAVARRTAPLREMAA
ncbi:hypothetical protein [Arthrobacter sp. AL12]|nr:hypothetical protein [Arthrobacter sp. AL12]MDI3213977.1 hypothetical protein [Arthrobacter sp. AL12]